jgi:peptidoglycan hydrolase CwlO-like protein
VYRKIANVREFVVNEGKRINGTLLAFQNKYEAELSSIDKKHQDQHDHLAKDTADRFDKVAAEHARLTKEIETEREERIKQNEESFAKILARVQGSF